MASAARVTASSGMSGIRNRSLALAVPLDREPLDQLGRVARPRRVLNGGVVVRAVLQPPDEPLGAQTPKSQSASLGTLLGDEGVEPPAGLDPLGPVAIGEAPANWLDRVVSHVRHLPPARALQGPARGRMPSAGRSAGGPRREAAGWASPIRCTPTRAVPAGPGSRTPPRSPQI